MMVMQWFCFMVLTLCGDNRTSLSQVVVGTFFTETRKKAASGGGTPGTKPSTKGPAGMQLSLQQMNMDGADRVHDHNMGNREGEGEEPTRAYHVTMPSAMDWGGPHFDTDTREDTDHATSPSEP